MQRIQRKRTKGWKMPENTVYVGRPTKWGNPCKHPDRKRAVEYYIGSCLITLGDSVKELKGKNLACFCPLDQPCHADVLLEYANR